MSPVNIHIRFSIVLWLSNNHKRNHVTGTDQDQEGYISILDKIKFSIRSGTQMKQKNQPLIQITEIQKMLLMKFSVVVTASRDWREDEVGSN
jgi:hypothetical protein